MSLKSKILLHVFFWIGAEVIWYRSCYPLGDLFLSGVLLPGEIAWIACMHFVHLTTFYTFYLVFIAEHTFNKKIIGMYVAAYIFICVLRYYGLNALYEVFDHPYYFDYMRLPRNTLYETLMLALFATFIGLIESRVKFVRLKKELSEQNIKSEMALLRSQVNPHFLYNVLNNIYSLAYPESAKAAQAVMKLSDIMRYSLTEANNKFVPLQKEIDYLNSYISLEKMRYRDSSFIKFSATGELNHLIAPMIFIPFVENAFKYGIIESPNSAIQIKFNVEGDMLNFEVINYYCSNGQESNGGGIGLRNVKRRLELIYPKKHELTVDDDKKESRFTVKLKVYF